ncbi:MAG: D-alanine--D-alanine ligase [Candidatus Doudnabacteria bacterium]|nr:D-alanine--D-alanine ligase [Candidatus Doudnabacteria bacterium]
MNNTIGVFFGSRSPEHDVSIITAQLIISGLKGLEYNVVPVYITKQGKWMLGEGLDNLKQFTEDGKKIDEQKNLSEYFLDMEESFGKLVFKKKGLMGKSVEIDLAFPAFHGSYGEDGTIQGMFEMLGVPYVGCNVPASAIAMDKAFTKQIMLASGIPTTKFVVFEKQDWETNREIETQRIRELAWPVFVKPVHLGSSIGIGKARDEKELQQKVEVAFYYDNKVLVEEAVNEIMDVTCCVIGNETLTASLLQESLYNKDMFDFDEKYLKDGGAQTGNAQNSLVIPARLDEQATTAIQDCAKQVYKALGCSGIARVDFLFDKQSKKFFANEVNPLPGTLYHHLWKASGLEFPELLRKLISFAEEKAKEKKEINYTFESSLLTSLKGSKIKSTKLN